MIASIPVWSIILIFSSIIMRQVTAGLFHKDFGIVIDSIKITSKPDIMKSYKIDWYDNYVFGYINVTKEIPVPVAKYTLEASHAFFRRNRDEINLCNLNAKYSNKITEMVVNEFRKHINPSDVCPIKPKLYKFENTLPDDDIKIPTLYKSITFKVQVELFSKKKSIGHGEIKGKLVRSSYLNRNGCTRSCIA